MFITSSTNSWLEFILNKECFGGAGGIFFFGNAFLSYKYRKNICEKEPCKDNLITGRRLKFIVSLQLFSMYADNTSYILLTFLHTKHFFQYFQIWLYFINIVMQVYHYFLFHIFFEKKNIGWRSVSTMELPSIIVKIWGFWHFILNPKEKYSYLYTIQWISLTCRGVKPQHGPFGARPSRAWAMARCSGQHGPQSPSGFNVKFIFNDTCGLERVPSQCSTFNGK